MERYWEYSLGGPPTRGGREHPDWAHDEAGKRAGAEQQLGRHSRGLGFCEFQGAVNLWILGRAAKWSCGWAGEGCYHEHAQSFSSYSHFSTLVPGKSHVILEGYSPWIAKRTRVND